MFVGGGVWWWWDRVLTGLWCDRSLGDVEYGFSGEILVGSSGTNAVAPTGGIIPSRRASWLPFVHFPMCAGGRTLGPSGLGSSGRYASSRCCLVRGGGSPSFSRSAFVSFLFLLSFVWVCVFAAAPALCFVSRLVVISGGCYINVAGRKAVSRRTRRYTNAMS
jgi:hypothetical protein